MAQDRSNNYCFNIYSDDDYVEDNPNCTCYHWTLYKSKNSINSILEYVEKNSERIKNKYLSFVFDFSETEINDFKLLNLFEINDEFNFWWMSLIQEKNLVKSPRISDCLKLFALEEIILDVRPEKVNYIGSDKLIGEVINILCNRLNIPFQGYTNYRITTPKNIYSILPHIVQGFGFLLKAIIKNWNLTKGGKGEWFGGNDSIFILSHFFNLDENISNTIKVYSKYWESFPDEITKSGIKLNWLYHFMQSSLVPNNNKAISWVNKLNFVAEASKQKHNFIYSYLDMKIIFRTIHNYLTIYFRLIRVTNIPKFFFPKGSSICLWPFLQYDWNTSTKGKVLIENILWYELLNKIMAELPKQKLGLYLQENSGWERAFIYSWKKNGHAELIGVTHTTIRYWDLRFFDDQRLFQINNNKSLHPPRPDFVALNGPLAHKHFIKSGFPKNEILNVEAVRYLNKEFIGNFERKIFDFKLKEEIDKSINVLICGDIDFESTNSMLKCLESCLRNISSNKKNSLNFTFKAHPACRISLQNYEIEFLNETSESLESILIKFDTIISTDSTTAGVEAYLKRLKVIVFSFTKRVNFSPLRGLNKIHFVSDSEEMNGALFSKFAWEKGESPEHFFWSESSLPKWRNVLSNFGYPQLLNNNQNNYGI